MITQFYLCPQNYEEFHSRPIHTFEFFWVEALVQIVSGILDLSKAKWNQHIGIVALFTPLFFYIHFGNYFVCFKKYFSECKDRKYDEKNRRTKRNLVPHPWWSTIGVFINFKFVILTNSMFNNNNNQFSENSISFFSFKKLTA